MPTQILAVQLLAPEPAELCNKRMLFLRTASKHRGINLGDSYRRIVAEPFEAIWRELDLPVPNVTVSQWTDANFQVLDELYRERDERIQRWMTKSNLDYEWVRRFAIDELGALNAHELRPGNFIQLPDTSREPAPHWEWWRDESASHYRTRRRQHCKKEANAYIRAIERARKPPSEVTARHYRWAAEWVCLDWTWDQIAKSRYNDTPVHFQAVSQAVLPILEELGIRTQRNRTKR